MKPSPSAPVPALETERLRLRGHEANDLSAAFAVWSNPEVVRFIGGTPSTEQETWMRILRYRGLWSMLGFGFWALEDKATGRYAGEAGFFTRLDLTPSMDGAPELGWTLAPEFHGRGLATEALRTIQSWGDARLPRTFCMIEPGNLASLRVAAKLGYAEKMCTVYKGSSVVLLDRTAPHG